MDRFWDIWDASDKNYIVNIFLYIISSVLTKSIVQKWHGTKKVVFCKVARKISSFRESARKVSSFWESARKGSFSIFQFHHYSGKIMKLGILESLITNMTSGTVPGARGARPGMPRVGVIFRSFPINRREIDRNFLLGGFRCCWSRIWHWQLFYTEKTLRTF